MTKEKYVRITRPKLRSLFLEYNQKCFNNEVEEPEIIELWTPSKYCVGWVRATWHNKERRHVAHLHISRQINWLEDELRDVMVHEMIHLLIKDYLEILPWWKRLLRKDHDRRFVDKMNELNEKYGLNVMVRSKHLRKYLK